MTGIQYSIFFREMNKQMVLWPRRGDGLWLFRCINFMRNTIVIWWLMMKRHWQGTTMQNTARLSVLTQHLVLYKIRPRVHGPCGSTRCATVYPFCQDQAHIVCGLCCGWTKDIVFPRWIERGRGKPGHIWERRGRVFSTYVLLLDTSGIHLEPFQSARFLSM